MGGTAGGVEADAGGVCGADGSAIVTLGCTSASGVGAGTPPMGDATGGVTIPSPMARRRDGGMMSFRSLCIVKASTP